MTMPRSGVPMAHRTQLASERSRKAQQIDLFGDLSLVPAIDTPAWRDLPTETRSMLTSLMTRLILEHVQASGGAFQKEACHDR